MTDCVDIRPPTINQQVHGEFTGGTETPGQPVAFEICDHDIIGGHHALADTRRRGQDTARIETNGDVAVVGGDVGALVEPTADRTNVAPVLFFRLHGARRN